MRTAHFCDPPSGPRRLVVSLLLALVSTTSALAFGELPSSREAPRFERADGTPVDALPLKSQRSIVEVAGVVARVRIEQVYRNDGAVPIEATYVFPTSTGVAVHDLRMRIGEDRELVAEIRAKEAAQQIFEAAHDNGQTAGLLQQQRPNVVSMSVTNLMPREEITVFVEASELITPKDGIYELVLPQSMGPRFHGNAGSEAFIDNVAIEPAAAKAQGALVDTTVDVTVRSPIGVRSMGSPTHAIAPHFDGRDEGRVVIRSSDADVVADRDVVLRWRLASDKVETGVMLFRDRQTKEHFFMLMGESPPSVPAKTAPPREIIFVVDVSGSMSGFPLQTAQSLMVELSRELRPTDTFNIVNFAGGSEVLSPSGSLLATPENLRAPDTQRMMTGTSGGGGTQLLNALERSFALPRGDVDGVARARTVVVITDGMISAERAAFDLVRSHLGDATLFAFGVHGNVNRFLIEGLAAAGKTEPFVVVDPAVMGRAVEHFRSVSARPALTNIHVAFDGFAATDLEPASPTDLYPGRPLVMLGRFTGPSSGRVVVEGDTAAGRFRQVLPIEDHLERPEHAPLRQLWARERVARLADRDTPSADDQKAILDLGLRYRLLTEQTSFVVVDPRRRAGQAPTSVAQPLIQPRGVRADSVQAHNMPMGTLGLAGAGIGSGYGSAGLGLSGRGAGGGGRGGEIGYGAGPRPLGPKADRDITMSTGKPVVLGSLAPDVVRRVVGQHRAQLQYCYERELNKDPTQGKLRVKIVIGRDGRVSAASLADGDKGFSEAVTSCVLARVKTWHFPRPIGGGVVTVTYPMEFRFPR